VFFLGDTVFFPFSLSSTWSLIGRPRLTPRLKTLLLAPHTMFPRGGRSFSLLSPLPISPRIHPPPMLEKRPSFFCVMAEDTDAFFRPLSFPPRPFCTASSRTPSLPSIRPFNHVSLFSPPSPGPASFSNHAEEAEVFFFLSRKFSPPLLLPDQATVLSLRIGILLPARRFSRFLRPPLWKRPAPPLLPTARMASFSGSWRMGPLPLPPLPALVMRGTLGLFLNRGKSPRGEKCYSLPFFSPLPTSRGAVFSTDKSPLFFSYRLAVIRLLSLSPSPLPMSRDPFSRAVYESHFPSDVLNRSFPPHLFRDPSRGTVFFLGLLGFSFVSGRNPPPPLFFPLFHRGALFGMS